MRDQKVKVREPNAWRTLVGRCGPGTFLLFICNWNKERRKPRGKNVTLKPGRVKEESYP